jgi:hypothetical protein
MKDYLLLFRGGDARMAESSEEGKNAHMAAWGEYMGGLQGSGNLAGGLPLSGEGTMLTNNGTSDSLAKTEAGEVVGGYLLIKANDMAHAVELSKPCPVFEYDGNVEIREALQM